MTELFIFPHIGASSSLFTYLRSEVTRGYQLENDEERYKVKREKVRANS